MAPFENDIKGAVFEVQDSERYRLWYRNGQMRKGHANWHFSLYKDYYRAFENKWQNDFLGTKTESLTVPLGSGTLVFNYDPTDPPAFKGEGCLAENFDDRKDVVSVQTPPFPKDTFVKGEMKLKLSVESNCQDTSFYVRISIKKPQYTYGLRHDIPPLLSAGRL